MHCTQQQQQQKQMEISRATMTVLFSVCMHSISFYIQYVLDMGFYFSFSEWWHVVINKIGRKFVTTLLSSVCVGKVVLK